MKTFILLSCAGILVFISYMAFTSSSPEKGGSETTDIPYRYGVAAPSDLYTPSVGPSIPDPDSVSTSVLPNPIKLSQAERNHFKGILELPKKSFIYVVLHLSQDELNRLMMYGIIQISHHPKKVEQYAYRLYVCHSLHNQAAIEPEQEPDEQSVPSGQVQYTPENSSYQGTIADNDLVSWLPGSTLIPYKSIVSSVGSLLIFLYYSITGLCCLVVAGFIGYHLLHLPWQQSISLTLTPRPKEFFAPYSGATDDSTNPPS